MSNTANNSNRANSDPVRSFFGGPRFQDSSFARNNVVENTPAGQPALDDNLQVTSDMLDSIALPNISPVSSASNASNDFGLEDFSGLAALSEPDATNSLLFNCFGRNLEDCGEVQRPPQGADGTDAAYGPDPANDLPIPESNIIVPAAPAAAPEPAPAAISTALLGPAFAPTPPPAYDASMEPDFVPIEDVLATIPPANSVVNPPTISPATFAAPSLPASASISPVDLSLKRKLPGDFSGEIDHPAPSKRRGRPPKKSLSPFDTPSTNPSPTKTVTPRLASSTARPSACVPAKFVKEAIEIMGVTAEEIKQHVDFDSLMTVVVPERREASLAFGARIALNRHKQAEAAHNTRLARAAQMQALENERDEANARANLLAEELARLKAELQVWRTCAASFNLASEPQPNAQLFLPQF